jgi:high-affinity iron transporter
MSYPVGALLAAVGLLLLYPDPGAVLAAEPGGPPPVAGARLVEAWPAARSAGQEQDTVAALVADLRALSEHAAASATALDRGDLAAARAAYAQFDRGWEAVEDAVRARSRDDYRAIERAMEDVRRALLAEEPDAAAARTGLQALRARVSAFLEQLAAPAAVSSAATPVGGTADAAARDALRPWAARIEAALARLEAGDAGGARAEFEAFRAAWPGIEDGIRAASRPHYREIERAMADVRAAFDAQPLDTAAVRAALERLRAVNAAFLAGAPVPEPGEAEAAARTAAGARPTPATLIVLLDRLLAALDREDVATARADLRTFQDVWLEVEGQVKARAPAVYTAAENHTAEAAAQLNRVPPDLAGARATLVALRAELAPVVEAGGRYGMWDAAVILLREGLEALLVVAALLAFLQRSGHADKQSWVWAGGLAGIAASVVVALTAQVVLDRAAANVSREAIEGVTGLVAAALLLYVGYWLHSKASLAAWQKYIHERSTAALARNSLVGLASIAFLAVFREGAETVLFYIGIAPGIGLADLLLGLAIGAGGLVALGILVLVVGLRVPVRPFFLAATVLIYYLCFKFVGTGIHALQVAGVVRATPAPRVPAWDWLGVFPTWETTLIQLVVLLLILAATFGPHLFQPRTAPVGTGSSS